MWSKVSHCSLNMMPMVPKGILQAAGTGNPELGRFERGFSV